MANFILDQDTVDMYQNTRSDMFMEALQQKISKLEPFATRIDMQKGKYFRIPYVGKAELKPRTQRFQPIEADEMDYGWRGIKPGLFSSWKKMSTDDPLFLNDLPITLDLFVRELGKAVERAKDLVLLGTTLDTGASSHTKGEYIIKKYNTVDSSATDGSPYKDGTTGGLFGDNYGGETGATKYSLPQMVRLRGETDVVSSNDEYTGESTTPIDTKLTNVVPFNYVPTGSLAASGITIEKILFALLCLQDRDAIESGEQVCMAITPKQQMELMMIEKLQNKNYGFDQLKTGFISSFLGVKFIVTPKLPLVKVNATKWVRACPIWVQKDLIYATPQSVRFQLGEDPTTEDTMRAGVKFGMGAARTREETFISIHCDEGFPEE